MTSHTSQPFSVRRVSRSLLEKYQGLCLRSIKASVRRVSRPLLEEYQGLTPHNTPLLEEYQGWRSGMDDHTGWYCILLLQRDHWWGGCATWENFQDNIQCEITLYKYCIGLPRIHNSDCCYQDPRVIITFLDIESNFYWCNMNIEFKVSVQVRNGWSASAGVSLSPL